VPFTKIISSVRRFKSGIVQTVNDAVKDIESFVLDMNRERLDKGKLSTNRIIQPRYTIQYKRYKSARGGKTDNVDLLLEGDFRSAFYIEYTSDGFEITSSDFKRPFLVKRYSEDIFGLTIGEKTRLAVKLLPVLTNKLRDYIDGV